MELQPYEYREDFLIYRHDGDFLGNIHPGTLFRYAQQIANHPVCSAWNHRRDLCQDQHGIFAGKARPFILPTCRMWTRR